jgi:hypothetical protein
MRRSSEPALIVLAGALVALACGDGEDTRAAAAGPGAVAVQPAAADPRPGAPGAASGAGSGAQKGMTGRTRELVNPEPLAVVLLRHDLSGTTPPFARWVEEDPRVAHVPAIEKQSQREVVWAEFDAAFASVHDVGALRLSMDAELSDYDPTYGEFTVRSLAPSRVVTFDAMQEHVELRFANGLDAQTWRVPAEEAQLVRDKLGPTKRAMLDVLVRITDLQPGGTIVTEVVEYELRVEPSGERLARLRMSE